MKKKERTNKKQKVKWQTKCADTPPNALSYAVFHASSGLCRNLSWNTKMK